MEESLLTNSETGRGPASEPACGPPVLVKNRQNRQKRENKRELMSKTGIMCTVLRGKRGLKAPYAQVTDQQ